jgi:HEAT repeat protein
MSIARPYRLRSLLLLACTLITIGSIDQSSQGSDMARAFIEALRRAKAGTHRTDSFIIALEPAQIPSLLTELHDANPKIRVELIRALIHVSTKLAVARDIANLGSNEDEAPSEAEKAASALLLRLRTQCARAILPLLSDGDPSVRWHATIALGAFQAEAKTVVPLLLQMVRTENGWIRIDDRVQLPDSVQSKYNDRGAFDLGASTRGWEHSRIAAIQALGAFGAEAERTVPELAKILSTDRDVRVRWFAAAAIAHLGASAKTAVPALVDALRSTEIATGGPAGHRMEPTTIEDGPIRLAAAVALGEIGPEARGAVAGLTGALSDDDPRVRGEAAAALGKIGPDAARTVEPLARLAAEECDESVAELAFWALTKIGEASVSALMGIARTGHTSARERAISAVAEIGRGADSAIPDLIGSLADPEASIRMAAAHALGTISIGPGTPTVVPALIDAVEDPDPDVRGAAVDSLGIMRASADRAIPVLVGALNDVEIQDAALRSLERIGMPAFPAIRPLLQSTRSELRNSAVGVLSRLARIQGDNRAQDESREQARNRVQAARAALLEASKDPDERIRTGADRALSLGDDNILADMVADLADGSPSVRLRAARSLGFMGSEAASVLASLGALLRDPDPTVRGAAQEAIKEIQKPDR